MVRFENFKKSILADCVDVFLKDRVVSKSETTSSENPEALCIAKQDSLA